MRQELNHLQVEREGESESLSHKKMESPTDETQDKSGFIQEKLIFREFFWEYELFEQKTSLKIDIAERFHGHRNF